MKKTVPAAILAILAIMWGFLATGNPAWGSPGKIVIYPDHQEINFSTLGNGGLYLEGLGYAGFIRAEYVKEVVLCSDRLGWEDKSICRVPFSLKVTIPKTPNNDTRCTWAVKMETGEYYYFVLDPNALAPGSAYWEIDIQIPSTSAKPKYLIDKVTPEWTSYLLQYGNYKEPAIHFFLNRAEIHFGCNLLIGLDMQVEADKVVGALWNSDRVGWKEKSSTWGELFTDCDGNYIAVIGRTPKMDEGNFCLWLKDGRFAWTMVTFWKFQGARVTVNPAKGLINYCFQPNIAPALNLLLGDD